jgi:hypothetical protein
MIDLTFRTGIQARAADISKPACHPLIQGSLTHWRLDDRPRQPVAGLLSLGLENVFGMHLLPHWKTQGR